MEPVVARPTPDWLGGKEALPWSWAVEKLKAERNYWIVSARRDGFPQARPVWGVWQHEGLFLSVGHGGLQRTAARDTPAMPVTVHIDSAVDVVIIEGVIDRIDANQYEKAAKVTLSVDAAAVAKAFEVYRAKYSSENDALSLEESLLNFLVRPRVVFGWRDEDVKTATKWTFPHP